MKQSPAETVANAVAVMREKMQSTEYRAASIEYGVFSGKVALEVASELASAKAEAAYQQQLAQADAHSKLSEADKAKLLAHKQQLAKDRKAVQQAVDPKVGNVSKDKLQAALDAAGIKLNAKQQKKLAASQ